MFPWASLISLAGQGIGGIMSAMSARKEKQAADAEAARQQAHYEAKANEDALSRSENRQLLSEYDRKAQKQVETAKNVAAITGATPEYGLAVQKAVAEGRADLMGDIAAGDSARKDKYEQLADRVRHVKAVADIQREAAKQESYANIIANSASAFGSMLGGYKAGDPSKAPSKAPEKVAEKAPEKVAVDLGNGQTVQANPLEAGVINTVVNARKNATAAPLATQQQPPVTSNTVDTILANKKDEHQTLLNYLYN